MKTKFIVEFDHPMEDIELSHLSCLANYEKTYLFIKYFEERLADLKLENRQITLDVIINTYFELKELMNIPDIETNENSN